MSDPACWLSGWRRGDPRLLYRLLVWLAKVVSPAAVRRSPPSIVIGADTHKGTHALTAIDEGTGRLRGGRQIDAEEAGHLAAVRWARELDAERVWATEDCRHVSRRLWAPPEY